MTRGRTEEPIEHGTYAGLQKHYRRKLPICTPCDEAGKRYGRNRRKALVRLAAEYPVRFAELMREEQARDDAG